MAKKYPNEPQAKNGFQILLEGAASADKLPVLRALVQSFDLCFGTGEKPAITLIRYFMEDNLLPHMESVLGVEAVRAANDDNDEGEAEAVRVCKSYLEHIGETMTTEELINFANLVIGHVD